MTERRIGENDRQPFRTAERKTNLYLEGVSIDHVPPGHIFYQEGDNTTDRLFVLHEGLTIVSGVALDGRKASEILKAKAFFGEEVLTGAKERLDTVEALSDCIVQRVSGKKLDQLLQEVPDLARDLIIAACRRVQRLKQRIYLNSYFTDKKLTQVFHQLANLPERYGEIWISHELIASLAGGMTRETASIRITKLLPKEGEGALSHRHLRLRDFSQFRKDKKTS